MVVMIVYVVLVAIGEFAAFFIAQFFDAMIPAAWSMIFFMALFFSVIALMWPVAVWMTERWFVRAEAAK